MVPETSGNGGYNASSITILEGLSAVRKRPAMYIGSTDGRGLHHLVYEVVDNSIDEAMAGYCSRITVILHADNSVTVRDDGRGIPVDIHPKEGVPAVQVVMTKLHAGGKFDNTSYKVSGGLHGVGVSCVNALSEELTVTVRRDGKRYRQHYARGVPQDQLAVIGEDVEGHGTTVRFRPDEEIFEVLEFSYETLKKRFEELAYLNKGLIIECIDERIGETHVFHAEGGIRQFVADLNSGEQGIHSIIFGEGMVDSVTVDFALQYNAGYKENILTFANNIRTKEGGTHLVGFKTRFTNLINTYARELGILKEKDTNFTGADTRNGMTAVVAVKHPDPIFEGQTKTKLASADATKAVFSICGEELQLFFDRNLEVLKSIIACAEKSAKIRKAEEKARTNMLSKSRFSFDSNGKLANCESRDPSRCEIFIVEGDSAGGSAKMGRNRQYQAILPIRGKILNVEKASMDKVLANAEIKTMINAFGCGFSEGYGNDFDITKLKYDKIVLMTDADVDGSHIDTLLLTFLYRFMPELIYDGHVYIAMPPLYKVVPKRGEERYLYDDKALEEYKRTHSGDFTLQRYKGLGEMDADQLWETTLNPENRVLKRVEIEDARMASEVTELLMGSDVPPRKKFIYDHADEAEIDA